MRIISGTYGGRFLEKVPGSSTRPTSDKVKESLFNMIGPYFKAGKVLDLYAGSGSLGIEAVSRGMSQAVLVDSNQQAIETIYKNVDVTAENDKFEVINDYAETALNRFENRQEKFTLVFLDPPYMNEIIEENIVQLIEKDLLADISIIVCEVSSKVKLPEKIIDVSKWAERKFGNKKIVIYQKK